MPSIRGHVMTDRPHRYLKQFRQHADGISRMNRDQSHNVAVEASPHDDVVTITFGSSGQCRLTAVPAGFVVEAEADSKRSLARITDRVARNIERFSAGELTVIWDRNQRRKATVIVAVTVLAALAIHLGVGAYAMANWRWSAAAAAAIAAALAVKVGLVAILGHRHRVGSR